MRQRFFSIRKVSLALATLALCGGVSSTALAQSAVGVTGKLTAGTCQWGVGGADHAVLLDPIYPLQLKPGQIAGVKSFTLTLTNCTPGLASATFTFSGTSDATDKLRYRNSSTASGVAVELQSADGKTIGADGTDNQRIATVSGNQIVLPLQAGYWQVGAVVKPGNVETAITFTIQYK